VETTQALKKTRKYALCAKNTQVLIWRKANPERHTINAEISLQPFHSTLL
jgi:hypothetical protein